jgi:hypothetical protein
MKLTSLCPCDCSCIPCRCMKDDDYFYILCTDCMFSLLGSLRNYMYHDWDYFNALRRSFNFSFSKHAHKTLIVLPIHIMHDSASKKAEKWASQIVKDIPINLLGSTVLQPEPWDWKPSKSKSKKNKVVAYAVYVDGTVSKITR